MTDCALRVRLFLLLTLVPSSAAMAQAPGIRGFTPDSGPPGTLVKIIGERFDTVTEVLFNGVESPSVLVVHSNHLKAVVPEGATTGPVGLLGPNGVLTETVRPFVVVVPVVRSPPPPPLALAPPRPSPAPGSATLGFSLPTSGRVRLEAFDLQGQSVRVLVDADLPAGPHERHWDGRDGRGRLISNGIYFVQLQTEGARLARRIILIR